MDEYEKLKYNPQFLKKAYDLVKDDFPKLFKDGDDYTEEDEKNWNIALNKIYDNFVTPEEDDFIEIWGETDGTIGLIDYVHENENQFMESSDKYVEAFRESCRKLEEVSVGKELKFSKADGDYGAYYDPYTNETVIYKITKDVLQRVPGKLNQDEISDCLYRLGK